MSAIVTKGRAIADRLRLGIGLVLWWFIEPVEAQRWGEFRSRARENRRRLHLEAEGAKLRRLRCGAQDAVLRAATEDVRDQIRALVRGQKR